MHRSRTIINKIQKFVFPKKDRYKRYLLKYFGTFTIFIDRGTIEFQKHRLINRGNTIHRFTINFIEGAGEVDGEILETLWSNMDEVSGLAQAMLVAHHQEVIDDNMNDSNWHKIIRIGKHLYYLCHVI